MGEKESGLGLYLVLEQVEQVQPETDQEVQALANEIYRSLSSDAYPNLAKQRFAQGVANSIDSLIQKRLAESNQRLLDSLGAFRA